MKFFKSSTAMLLALTMALTTVTAVGTGNMAFASSETTPMSTLTTNASQPAIAPNDVRSTLEGLATVDKINGDNQLTIQLEDQTIVLNVNETTLFIDAKTGLPSNFSDIKANDLVYVFYSAAMTRSLPPQSKAIAIVTGAKKDQTIPKLMTVKKIMDSKEGQISFLNTDEDMVVTILKENPISPFKTKQIVTYKDIQPGSKVFVWYDIVLMSYPGQTTATKTVFVSAGDATVTTPLYISVNGKVLNIKTPAVIERDGKYLVPLKAVSNALGFHLKWDAKTRTAAIDNGVVKTTVTVGKDAYYKASSKAIGLTNTFTYGASPEIVNGTLYVPSDLFSLLFSNEGTVKMTNDTLQINTSEK